VSNADPGGNARPLDAARWYVSRGFSVIPVKADGTKSPAFTGWRKFSDERPDDRTLVEWFGDSGDRGVGVPAGSASGNLAVIDFECRGEAVPPYDEWLGRLPPELRAEAERLPTVATPTGGRHVWVRLAEPQPGGRLARYAGGNGKTKVEVRGDGHFVLAPGCPADCHETGKLYEWVRGLPADGSAFRAVDADTWVSLVRYAAECNEFAPPEQPRDRGTARPGTPAGADAPGTDFNRRGTWAEAGLFDAGWAWAREVGPDKGFLTRPGKERGVSASAGMVASNESGWPLFYVWSTSTDFDAERGYSKFAVFAMLNHGGDFAAAAGELRDLGYGADRTVTLGGKDSAPGAQPGGASPDPARPAPGRPDQPDPEQPDSEPPDPDQPEDDPLGGGKPAPDFAAAAGRHRAKLARFPGQRDFLAADLGVPAEALAPFGVGVDAAGGRDRTFTIPESDGAGVVIGLATWAYRGGKPPVKRCVRGGKRGLVVPDGWCSRPGPLFVAEGFADAAALYAAGLAAVGHPGTAAGSKYLAELLRGWPADRAVVVVGRNDSDPDGGWPGRDGAELAAARLEAALNREVLFALPPADAEDVRAWLTSPDRQNAPLGGRGGELAELLTAAAAAPDAAAPDGREFGVDALDPQALRDTFLADFETAGAAVDCRLKFWNGSFREWSRGCWREWSPDEADGRVRRHAEWEARRDHRAALRRYRLKAAECAAANKQPPKPPTQERVTEGVVRCAAASIKAAVLLPASTVAPSWLTPRGDRPDPARLVPTTEGIIDPATGELLPASPELFCVYAVPHPPADAAEPTTWLAAVARMFEGDPECVGALQEFVGLCLIPDTSFQKACLVVGPSNSGKGVVSQVLGWLVGEENYGGAAFDKLGDRFTLSGLAGKAAVVIDDFRAGDGRGTPALATFLSVVGGGLVPIDRKNKDPISGRVGARLLLLSNELPRLRDDSPTAIARRLLVLPTGPGLAEAEADPAFARRLSPELPGIFAWALAGLHRLLARGHFVQPGRGASAIDDLKAAASDVGGYVTECLVADPEAWTPTPELYGEWERYCERNNIKSESRIGTTDEFISRLKTVLRNLEKAQRRTKAGRQRGYVGVRVRARVDDAEPSPPSQGGTEESEGGSDKGNAANHGESASCHPCHYPYPSSSHEGRGGGHSTHTRYARATWEGGVTRDGGDTPPAGMPT
jgi:putative DNA primase/helicase